MADITRITSEETEVGIAVLPGAAGADGATSVMITVNPPEGTKRTPVDICCVVDVSGSMGAEATIQQETGETAGHGLSVLDVVKHAMKTIIRNLEAQDRLALVSYSNEATTVFGVTVMDEAGRKTTEEKLEDISPSGMTNLWDGLRTGIELLKAAREPGRLQHVMLFTDGLPNMNPPRGILPMVRRMKMQWGGSLPCTVSTFGFGYELDSELLNELAIIGSGTYAFIPDAGFVGTVFVNAMTNLLVTMAKDVKVTLTPRNGAALVGYEEGTVLGGHPVEKLEGGAMRLDIGTLQFGQTKDVVVRMSLPGADAGEYLQAELLYGSRAQGEPTTRSAKGSGPAAPDNVGRVERQRLRLGFADAARRAMKAARLSAADQANGKALPLEEARLILTALAQEIGGSRVAEEETVKALLDDLNGQMAEAFSREDWYKKWGVHFVPSLMCAHLAQICNNFKDPGVQHYGGKLFNELRDKADDIFCNLPAPKPSARPVAAATAAPAPVSMAAYYDCGAG